MDKVLSPDPSRVHVSYAQTPTQRRCSFNYTLLLWRRKYFLSIGSLLPFDMEREKWEVYVWWCMSGGCVCVYVRMQTRAIDKS